MTIAAGPFVIAALLLAFGGASKLWRPADTATALRVVGLSGDAMLVRVGGLVEVVIGVSTLAVGGPVAAALVACSYVAFAVFVAIALRAGTPISSCGCFGKVDTPPSAVHVVIDLVAAAVAVVAAFGGDVSLPAILAEQPLWGAPFVLLTIVGCYAVFLAFTDLPRTLAAVRAVREARG